MSKKQYKPYKWVMQDTNDSSSDLLKCIKTFMFEQGGQFEDSDIEGNLTMGYGTHSNDEYYTKQHLYILSDEEIKKDDWCVESSSNRTSEPFQVKEINTVTGICRNHEGLPYVTDACKKILATNNFNLHERFILKLSAVFLKEFVLQYNEKSLGDDVLVEITSYTNDSDVGDYEEIIKIKSTHDAYISVRCTEEVEGEWSNFFSSINNDDFTGWSEEAINGYKTCRATIIEAAKAYNPPTNKT